VLPLSIAIPSRAAPPTVVPTPPPTAETAEPYLARGDDLLAQGQWAPAA